MPNARILIVEADAITAAHLGRIVKEMGYELVGMAATGEEAVDKARSERPDVILMDIRLRGEMTGIEAAEIIRREMDLPVIYLTAYTEESLVDQASMTQPYAYLVKPVRDLELRAGIRKALSKAETDRQLKHLTEVLRAVRDVNQLITREKDSRRLLEEACRILVQTSGYRLVWVGEEDVPRETVVPAAWAGEGASFLEKVKDSKEAAGSNFPWQAAFRKRQPVVCQDMTKESSFAIRTEDAFRSVASVPLLHGGQMYGLLSVLADRPNAFPPEEVDLLQELANDLAFALYSLALEADRARAEARVQESEAFTSSLLENSPMPILVVTGDTSVRYVNQAFEEMTGYTSAEIIGRRVPYPWWPEDPGSEDVRDRKIDILINVRRREKLFRRKNGDPFWVELSSIPIFRDGEFSYALTTWVDITDRKLADEALRGAEERYRKVFTTVTDGIMVFDGETQGFLDINEAIANLFGYTREEFLKLRLPEVSAEPEKTRIGVEHTLEGKIRRIPVRLFKRKDGSTFPAEVTVGGFMLKERKAGFGIIRDITERRRTEEAVRKASSFETLTAVLNNFIGDALSNLLTPIYGHIQLCQMRDNVQEMRNELVGANKAMKWLLAGINVYREFSRSDETSLGRMSSVDIRAVLGPLLSGQPLKTYRERDFPIDSNMVLKFVYDPNQEGAANWEALPFVSGSETAIGFALRETLINAVESYETGRGGEVIVSAKRENDLLKVEIVDRGRGMSDMERERSQLPFFKIPGMKRSERLGLGAYIGRQAASYCGGDILIESEKGVGTTASILLKVHKGPDLL